MKEKVNVDVEIPVKCSTVKSTIGRIKRFFSFIGRVIATFMSPFIYIICILIESVIYSIKFYDSFEGQIFGTFIMTSGLFVILNCQRSSANEPVLMYSMYIAGVLGFLLGFAMTLFASIEYYNIDLNIKCKEG
jgi:hypothetical protein